MMDDATRFWIAQQVLDNKGTSEETLMARDFVYYHEQTLSAGRLHPDFAFQPDCTSDSSD